MVLNTTLFRSVFIWVGLGILFSAEAIPGTGPRNFSQGSNSDQILERAIVTLEKSTGGKLLLEKAIALWNLKTVRELSDHLRWDSTSRTDAVLTRQYDPVTGQESRTREVTIYLRRTISMQELVLDLAHELVHATSRPAWDPYDPALTAGKYIWTSLEGAGGEVEAVIAECRVSSEIPSFMPLYKKRCGSYLDPSRTLVDRTKVRQDFYRVGRWNQELQRELGAETVILPLLTQEEPKLFSSTGSTPYPVALLREYRDLTKVACDNSKKRIELAGAHRVGRTLASEAATESKAFAQQNQKFLNQRCRTRTF